MPYSSFSDFKLKNLQWENRFEIYQRDDKVYKRLICRWNESPALKHELHSCLNTDTGEIYIDCRRRKIFAKHLALAIGRPLHTVMKTLWHVSLIGPLALEVYKVMQEKQTWKDLRQNTIKSLADIVRTPLYGVAMTLTHLAGIVLGVVAPNTLYETRALAGKLERDMLRVNYIYKADGMWLLSPCFSPMKNILSYKSGEYLERSPEEMDKMLTGFAAANIRFRQKHAVIFNGCGRLWPKDQAYISSAKKTTVAHFFAWLEPQLPQVYSGG